MFARVIVAEMGSYPGRERLRQFARFAFDLSVTVLACWLFAWGLSNLLR